MQFIAYLVIMAVLGFSTSILAHPAAAGGGEDLMAGTHGGDLTYFDPGLGACGKTNSAGDAIVAVSHTLFDSQRPCDRRIRVHYNGKSTEVAIVDRCAGCAEWDLDLSPAAFDKLASEGQGRVRGSWEFI